MKNRMDVAVLEMHDRTPTPGSESSDLRFVHDLLAKPVGRDVQIEYIIYEEPHGVTINAVKDEGNQFTGATSTHSTMTVRPPVPEDAIVMAPDAGIAQPIEVVNAHIKNEGGYIAPALEAVVNGATTVLAVILRTGLGVYFREDGAWKLRPVEPRLTEGTTLQILAPDALDYWDDAEQPVIIYDLPYMVNGQRVDPSEREDAAGPAVEDQLEEEVP